MHDPRLDFLDIEAKQKWFARSAKKYGEAAYLAKEINHRLIERLQYIKLQPCWIVDMGAATGFGSSLLQQRFPKASVLALDFCLPLLQCHHNIERVFPVNGDAEMLPLKPHSVDLIYANLFLPHLNQLPKIMCLWRQLLKPGGLLLFSSLGPDTLKELRQAFANVDEKPHVQPFWDMHDVGDMMLSAGFVDPVMDMETITLQYADVNGLIYDLRGQGWQNALLQRRQTLMGKKKWQAMLAQYQQVAHTDGTIPATFEITYGHAWGPQVSGLGVDAWDLIETV